jgi:hypothetical protein
MKKGWPKWHDLNLRPPSCRKKEHSWHSFNHQRLAARVAARRRRGLQPERLLLVAVCHPFGEEIDAGLRPGTFPSRR